MPRLAEPGRPSAAKPQPLHSAQRGALKMAAPSPASPSLRHVTVASHHCISQRASFPSAGRRLVGGASAERRLTQPIGGRRPALRVLRRQGRVCGARGGGARRGRPGSGGGRGHGAGQRRGGRGKHRSPEPGSGGLPGLSQGKSCLKAARGCWGWAGIVGGDEGGGV